MPQLECESNVKSRRRPKGITPAEMYAIMAVSRLEGEGRNVRPGDIAKCGHGNPERRVPDLEIA